MNEHAPALKCARAGNDFMIREINLMVKLQSMGSDIERARTANAVLAAEYQGFFSLLESLEEDTVEPDQAIFDTLKTQGLQAEIALADIVYGLSQHIGSLYEIFGSINEATRYERFLALFSRRRAARHQALRVRGLAVSERLAAVLLHCDEASAIASGNRSTGIDLHNGCDRLSASLMQQRTKLGEAMEDARHALKEINASLATTQWRAGNTTDEARSQALLAERDSLSLTLEKAEVTYGELRARLDRLDRRIERCSEFTGLVGEYLSGSSLLLKKLICDMERAIQLQFALSGSLDGLFRKAAAHHPRLLELLELHAIHSISMDELEQRRLAVDQAFSARYRQEKGRVTDRTIAGVTQQRS